MPPGWNRSRSATPAPASTTPRTPEGEEGAFELQLAGESSVEAVDDTSSHRFQDLDLHVPQGSHPSFHGYLCGPGKRNV